MIGTDTASLDLLANGESLGFHEATPQEAESFCARKTLTTGIRHDWYQLKGRVHFVKARQKTPAELTEFHSEAMDTLHVVKSFVRSGQNMSALRQLETLTAQLRELTLSSLPN